MTVGLERAVAGTSPVDEPLAESLAESLAEPFADRLAHAISVVCAPPSLAVPLVALAAHEAAGQPGAVAGAAILLATTALLPSLFILAAHRAGYVGSLDLTRRTERVIPSLFAAGCAATAYPLLVRWEAPAVLIAVGLAIAVQLGVLALVTTVWQVSYHAAAAGGLAALAYSLDGAAVGLLLLSVAALVAWARVHLRRHTRAQVAAGLFTSAPVLFLDRVLAGATG